MPACGPRTDRTNCWPPGGSAEDPREQVWGEHAEPFTNTVAVMIGRSRRTWGAPPVPTTTPGVGYRIA